MHREGGLTCASGLWHSPFPAEAWPHPFADGWPAEPQLSRNTLPSHSLDHIRCCPLPCSLWETTHLLSMNFQVHGAVQMTESSILKQSMLVVLCDTAHRRASALRAKMLRLLRSSAFAAAHQCSRHRHQVQTLICLANDPQINTFRGCQVPALQWLCCSAGNNVDGQDLSFILGTHLCPLQGKLALPRCGGCFVGSSCLSSCALGIGQFSLQLFAGCL